MNGFPAGRGRAPRPFDAVTLAAMYRRVSVPEDLPWHRDEPPVFLQQFIEARGVFGRALDIGCGSGETAVYLAGRGYQVTGVDFLDAPLRFAKALARQARVQISFLQQNVLYWDAPGLYDLVVDLGCLHHIDDRMTKLYRRVVLRALTSNGDLIIGHLATPISGSYNLSVPLPRCRTVPAVRRLFASALRLREHAVEHVCDSNLGRLTIGFYRFTRSL